MESNPAYQCSSSKQEDDKDHHYEAINSGDKVVKFVANKCNTISDSFHLKNCFSYSSSFILTLVAI